MPISRYIVAAVVRCSCGLRVVARAAVELAEAEVAVGDERAHAELGGECEGLAVVALGPLDLERIATGDDLTEQMEHPGLEASLPRCRCLVSACARCFERFFSPARQEVDLRAPDRGETTQDLDRSV